MEFEKAITIVLATAGFITAVGGALYDSMNQGQRKKLIKNTELKKLLEFYGVEV